MYTLQHLHNTLSELNLAPVFLVKHYIFREQICNSVYALQVNCPPMCQSAYELVIKRKAGSNFKVIWYSTTQEFIIQPIDKTAQKIYNCAYSCTAELQLLSCERLALIHYSEDHWLLKEILKLATALASKEREKMLAAEMITPQQADDMLKLFNIGEISNYNVTTDAIGNKWVNGKRVKNV